MDVKKCRIYVIWFIADQHVLHFRTIIEVGIKANHSPLLFHRSRHPPSNNIIAQKLRTVTAAHRFEVNLRKMLNLLKNVTHV